MDAMRVQILTVLCSAGLAFAACSNHDIARPNGHGHFIEVPENIQALIPGDTFPKAKLYAQNCFEEKDPASCNYLGWMFSVGAEAPVVYADETDDRVAVEDSYHLKHRTEYAPMPKDLDAAKALFKSACDAGWSSACVSLINAGGDIDAGQALVKACSFGDTTACNTLGEGSIAGAIPGLDKASIITQLNKFCNDGRLSACQVQAQIDETVGQTTQRGEKNPRVLVVSKGGSSAAVTVYSDNTSDSVAVAGLARSVFGDETDVTISAAKGAVSSKWVEMTPSLLALANGVPNSAQVTLREETLTFRSDIPNAEERASVKSALERIAGEDVKVRALLTQAEIDAADAAAEQAKLDAKNK